MISFDFTEALKSKSFYLKRRKAVAITNDNIRNVVMVGDISPTTFGQLSSFLNEVSLHVSGIRRIERRLFLYNFIIFKD